MSKHEHPPKSALTKCGWTCFLSIAFAAALGNSTVATAAPERCRARLQVDLEPSVPDPRDPSFLTALLANPLYTLTWVEGDDDMAVYELTGPPTDYRCEREIGLLRRAAHVMDVKVLDAGMEPDDNSNAGK